MAAEAEFLALFNIYKNALVGRTVEDVIAYPSKREVAIHYTNGTNVVIGFQSLDNMFKSIQEA